MGPPAPGYAASVRSVASFEPRATARLVLRRSVPEDAEGISVYRSLPEVRRYQGWERTDPDTLRAEIDLMSRRAPGDRGWVQLSVLERESGRLVGDVGMSPAEGEPGVMKIGYTIEPASQGRGYATEAVAALVDYLFDELGVEIVRMYADADNVASIRVAEKVGMRLEERFHRTSADESWEGVRYEVARDGGAAP
jgi:RimJ/RimL family protein N-acetyltransferase